ncbi:MAG TPA: glycosyltransferase family 2 protein [Phycisphaerales bacterium]|nr:glycosyltransferase family 2 protein [Phycisphaerales bacterium]
MVSIVFDQMTEPKPTVTGPADGRPVLSVVAPAHNEVENLERLIGELEQALTGIAFEVLIVDDASTDGSAERVAELQKDRPWLRLISLSKPEGGGGNGQSVAFKVGFNAARGELVGSLDADLQNDPADFPRLIDEMQRTGADFVQGDRSAARRQGDAKIRQVTSVIGRVFRRMILGDTIRDTGCSLRVMRREIAVQLPLEYKGMHRFIPVTARQLGYRVVEMPVAHRSRHAGEPKYGMGITKRAIPGLMDCFAVRWMRSRRRADVTALERGVDAASPEPAARGAEV